MTDRVGPRILVLEDEPFILMELSFAIEDRGATPVAANCLEQAFRELAGDPLDAAILDVNLGHGTTCEPIATRLQEIGVPFLIHSGDLMRQGEMIHRIDVEVIAKPAASAHVVDRALELAARRPEMS